MKRTERQHLRENEIAHTIEVVRDFFETRKRAVVAGGVGLALVAAAVVGWVVVRQRNESRGVELLADAMVALSAPVVPAGAAGSEDDLPASASLGATGSFATESAKLLAALPKLRAAADAHPDSGAGITARYHLAGALAALGRHDEAIKAFEEVVQRAGSASLYGRMARLGKADSQARGGEVDAAIATWNEIADGSADDFPVDAVLMELARAFVRKGDVERARKALTRIVDEHPDSPYTPEARSELDNLEG